MTNRPDPRDEAVALVGLLAEEERLRVVAALALGASTVEEVAERAGLAPRPAWSVLRRLSRGGLVERTPEGGWRLRPDRLKQVARAAAPAAADDDHGASDPRAAAVLRAFLRDGRLVSIPAVRSKRVVVLDHIAMVFEIGVRYPEREVDALLRAFHADHAALRRHLVDEGFLSREAGVYWRSGGTVPV